MCLLVQFGGYATKKERKKGKVLSKYLKSTSHSCETTNKKTSDTEELLTFLLPLSLAAQKVPGLLPEVTRHQALQPPAHIVQQEPRHPP